MEIDGRRLTRIRAETVLDTWRSNKKEKVNCEVILGAGVSGCLGTWSEYQRICV